MVVPSFSSKGFIDIDNIHRMLNKYIINSKLISAYDLYYKNIFIFITFIKEINVIIIIHQKNHCNNLIQTL